MFSLHGGNWLVDKSGLAQKVAEKPFVIQKSVIVSYSTIISGSDIISLEIKVQTLSNFCLLFATSTLVKTLLNTTCIIVIYGFTLVDDSFKVHYNLERFVL